MGDSWRRGSTRELINYGLLLKLICREGVVYPAYGVVHYSLTDPVIVATRSREQKERDRFVGKGDFSESRDCEAKRGCIN